MTGSVSSPGVAGPGADHAFLAAEFVAFARRLVQRTRNPRFDRVAVGTAGIGHVDRQRGAGALHGPRGRAVALALLERGRAGLGFAGIIIGLTVGAAFADRERARGPGFGYQSRSGQRHGQYKNNERAALRGGGRNDQNPLPESPGRARANLPSRTFRLGEQEIEKSAL